MSRTTRLTSANATAATLAACAVTWTLAIAPLSAQTGERIPEPSPRSETEVALTPFVSVGSDFSSQIGGAISFKVPASLSVEVDVEYRRREINALNASVNLLYDLPRFGRVQTYLAAGIGIEQYGVPLDTPTLGLITQRKSGQSTSMGAGIRVPVTGWVDYRSDVRWLNIWGQTPEGWRIYHGASFRSGKR